MRLPRHDVDAASGFGEAGRYTTTLRGSSDVSAFIVRLQPRGEEANDVGHAVLLFAPQVGELVWSWSSSWLDRP